MTLQTFDPRLCPLCGRTNQCAMEAARTAGQPQPACWCTKLDFSADLLARVPARAQRLACICPACAQSERAA